MVGSSATLHLQATAPMVSHMGTLSLDEAKRRLHEAGIRATAPRVAVLRLLSSATRPLSHTEVVDAIGSEHWDQATLYRNLVKLVEVQLARVVSKVGGVARYRARGDDDSPHLHPHFCCQTCGEVACLPEAKLTGPVDRRWHRSLETSEMQLIGYCPDCLAAQKRSVTGGKREKRRR
jgi:Fur family ferric uptake transcriptional regulator